MERFYQICELLHHGSDEQKQFLVSYKDQCNGYYRRPNANDFFQHVTMCPMGLHCPSLYDQEFQQLEKGYYTINSFQSV